MTSPSAYLPGEWLVPQFATLKAQIMGNPMEKPFGDKWESVIEQFPYCIGAASYAILELARVQHLTVLETLARSPHLQKEPVFYILAPPHRQRMGFLVDSFLEASCRAQNAMGLLIGMTRKVSLPSSMSVLVKRLKSERLELGELDPVVLHYWDTAGERLRQYRDLSQHHAVVSSHAGVFVLVGNLRSTSYFRTTPKTRAYAP